MGNQSNVDFRTYPSTFFLWVSHLIYKFFNKRKRHIFLIIHILFSQYLQLHAAINAIDFFLVGIPTGVNQLLLYT